MFAKIARIILAFVCFPLLGAYALAWVGAYTADLVALAGVHSPLLAWLDLAGAGVGGVLGILLAIHIIGCCLQSELSPVRGPGDNILIILAVTLLADVVLPRAMGQTTAAALAQWLPPVSLAVWGGCAAATLSLARMRQLYRAQSPRPSPPQAPDQGNTYP